MRAHELLEKNSKHHMPMSKTYSSDWDMSAGMKDLSSVVHYIEMKNIKPTLQKVPLGKLKATQDWVDYDEGGGDPVFPKYEDHIAVLHDKNGYHIIDGHHRTDKAIMRGDRDIAAWVFEL